MILTDPADIAATLRSSRVVAVLGASERRDRPGHYVPRYLRDQGYELHPVNPKAVGEVLFGRPTVARLADLEVEVDVVEVFRRRDHLPAHLDELLAMRPRPKTVWFQAGIRHDEVAAALSEAGIDVVQDRCMLIDHQRLL